MGHAVLTREKAGADLPAILPSTTRRRIFAYFGGLIVLLAFADPNGGLMDVPISFFLKNKLHLEASEVANFRR